MVRGANHAAAAPAVGGRAGAAARRPGLRRRLRLGLDRPGAARLPGGGDDHDAVAVSARVPARCERPRQPRRRARGGRAQPRPGTVADVPEGHAAPDPPGGARRLPARDARAAGRVRRLRNRPVPDVHGRDLHRVQARLRHGRGVRAVARARGPEHRRARRRAVARRVAGAPRDLAPARAGRHRASRSGASRCRRSPAWAPSSRSRSACRWARSSTGCARGSSTHAAVGLDRLRGRAHGRLQRRGGRARDRCSRCP